MSKKIISIMTIWSFCFFSFAMDKKNENNTHRQKDGNENTKKIDKIDNQDDKISFSFSDRFKKYGFKPMWEAKDDKESNIDNKDLMGVSNLRQNLSHFGKKMFDISMYQNHLISLYNQCTIENITKDFQEHVHYMNETRIKGFDAKKETIKNCQYIKEETIKSYEDMKKITDSQLFKIFINNISSNDHSIIDNIFDPHKKDETFEKQKKI